MGTEGGAKIKPHISFHGLRHTWASLAAMNGVPLMVVAKNLGRPDTQMVEKHYGHLAPSYITDAIHEGAPRFTMATTSNVEPLRSGESSRTLRIRRPQRSSASANEPDE